MFLLSNKKDKKRIKNRLNKKERIIEEGKNKKEKKKRIPLRIVSLTLRFV